MNCDLIQTYIDLKLSEHNDNRCFDCQLINPTFVSANNGIFLCFLCASIHKTLLNDKISLVVEIKSFKESILNEYLPYLINGGNKKLRVFFSNYGLMQTPDNICENKQKLAEKYKTNSGVYYRFALKSISEGSPTNVDPPSKEYGQEINGMYVEVDSTKSVYEGEKVEEEEEEKVKDSSVSSKIISYIKSFGCYLKTQTKEDKEDFSESSRFDRI